jgi:hypothetical protein
MGQKYTKKSTAELLAEETGEPASKFEPPEDIEYPELDELEDVPESEWD